MKKRFFIKALAVSLLLTLFSCESNTQTLENEESIFLPLRSKVPEYKQRVISLPKGDLYEIVTPKDTFLVFCKYRTGMVLLK